MSERAIIATTPLASMRRVGGSCATAGLVIWKENTVSVLARTLAPVHSVSSTLFDAATHAAVP
eukprot:CAMPEP_0180302308 /NCGR_PEP_ID=MMETSP0988-20121125/24177_1 /TAXON_ID=697907 /ORGANISM="non described non described, Strain CCMP2293" /LENGTH=62 /DNA_ID=CAMNT_0022283373 /DNA_START=108 /DNA_END=292 /DNA_ORIENTATION=+